MAVLFVTEYTAFRRQQGNIPAAASAPPVVGNNNVAIGVSSAQSAAFNAKTRTIRVHTDAICSIEIGSNPTATASSARMAANTTEYFDVNPGDKIAVIQNT